MAVELGVKVIPSVSGTITGVRFYKSAANTGPHVGNLWSTDGTNLASVTFADEPGSGWRQANFSTPVAVTANTTYVASYHTPSGHFALDSTYFANALVSGPLTAPSSLESGGNGVFKYGPSSFPNETFNAANYWVDVVFVEADTTAPTVDSISPSDGAAAVDVGVHPTATFSEPMDAATITSATVHLSGPGDPVAATVAYDADTRVATLTPTSPLATSTTYTMTVEGGAGGAADEAGNPLAADTTWSFTTAAPPGPDTTPPTITAMTPANGATGVALNVAPTVTFSEPMDPATITTTTVQLNGPGGVSATVAYDAATRRVTLTPASPLADSTTYTVVVKGRNKGVADTAGNTLAANASWSFTTVDLSPPAISAISVTSTPAGVATVTWTTNEPSTSRVDYGTNPASLGQNVSDPTRVTSHSIQIGGLTSGTTYYFRVTSVDAAGNSATSPAPPAAPASFTVASVRSPSGVVIETGSLRSGSAASLAVQDSSYLRVTSTQPLLGLIGTATSSWYGRFTGVPRPLASLKATYAGWNSRSCTQVLSVYRWTTGSWVQIDSRTVGTTEVKIADVATTGGATDYVSSGGEVRVRVRCTAGSLAFDANANLLQITIA